MQQIRCHLVRSVSRTLGALSPRSHIISRGFTSQATVPQRTPEDILKEIQNHPSEVVKLSGVDIDGIQRGKYVQKQKFMSAAKGGFGFCSVIFGWDSGDVCYDNIKYTGTHTGYPDTQAAIDLSTYRQIPWENNMPFFLVDFRDNHGGPLPICPRSLLKRVVSNSRSMGYEPLIGIEFEWFNFKETSHSWATKKQRDPEHLTPGMFGYSNLRTSQNQPFFHGIMNGMSKFGVPLEGFHTETGPGVMEAAIQFGRALESADRAVLFKTGVKEIGHAHGVMPSFMAKIQSDLPGCSGHVHQNLADPTTGTNLFYSKDDPHHMSPLFKSYLAGQLALLPEFLPFFAPTINSYKRLVDGYWAPTTPTWGVDNRTVGIRVLPDSAKACRLEFRVTGSDMNPYIAVAASVAAGLHGVKHNMELKQKPIVGSAYVAQQSGVVERLPRTLSEATERLANSKVAREALGDDFVDHFVETRRWEIKQFNSEVTDWETRRYFEII